MNYRKFCHDLSFQDSEIQLTYYLFNTNFIDYLRYSMSFFPQFKIKLI